jgi:dTDP-4-amino-4,6-dideoxygalactose transaminase
MNDKTWNTGAYASSATKIPVLRPRLPTMDQLAPYLRRIDASRIYSNFGPLARELGERLAKHFGLLEPTVVVAASGTAALVGAILATAGRASPDKPLAVVPAFTFVATASAAEACGYRILLADVDPDDFLLDPARLAADHRLDRVGLVVPVGAFGRAVDQAAWKDFRDKTGIAVVIDGAACFETATSAQSRAIDDIPVAISLHATKSFGAGEGGCVVTPDAELAMRIVRAINFGFFGVRDCESANINGKMSEYHAAVGLAELDGWPEKSRALLAVAETYRDAFEGSGLMADFFAAPEIGSCYALIRCETARDAERLGKALTSHAIGFRRWYGGGLHRHAYHAGLEHGDLAVTERLADCLLGLPTAPDLAAGDIRLIAGILSSTIGRERRD